MKRNALFASINLAGLVLGFICIIIIAIWIKTELSYDKFHDNSSSIYRVHRYFYDANGVENLHLPNVAAVIAPLLKNEFSDIRYITRLYHTGMVFSSGEKKYVEDNVCFAEPSVLNIFTFTGLPSDSNILVRPLTAIISDEIAHKYFHQNDVIGKTLEFKDEKGQCYNLEISGVYKKWNKNNHFNPDLIISFSTFESAVGQEEMNDWSSNNYETYALIPYLPSDMNSRLDAFIDKNLDNGTHWTKIRLEKLADVHFNWYSNRSYIYILISIALLILILGSINYMNLNAAMYAKQLKDITIKKIIGASRKALIFQLLVESAIFCLMALIIALYIASLTIPVINKILNNPLEFNLLEDPGWIAFFAMLAIFTGIFSSVYPALLLSSMKQGKANIADINKIRIPSFRNGLVTFQFVVTITLIISFLLISKQLNYLNRKELGLEKEDIVVIPAGRLLIEKLDVFKQQLLRNPLIVSVAASKRVPSDGLWDSNGARIISGSNVTPIGFRLANVRIDEDFIPTYKIKLVAGRNFYDRTGSNSGYILNEMAAKKIGWKSPEEALGQIIEYGGHQETVIGVVQDFHYESLHNPISPIIMYYDPSDFNLISVRIAHSEKNKTLSIIEKTWQEYNDLDFPFTYDYLVDRYRNLYKSEENIRSIFIYCMIIAFSIAILGLIGLSVYLTERRTKEIGIRKVNGARVIEVMTMLNRDFIKWVIVAFLIACPIAWYAMHKWLQSFAYRTTLSWWVFMEAGAIAVAVALLTVSWQSWRTATRNPVEALRYE
jgi:putative ABC transport system permease protein